MRRPKSLSSSGRFLCLVVVHVRPKSLSSSGRFLCPVVVHVRLKSLLSSGLSSGELTPLAIPNERATPQSGAPNSSQCSKCTMADVIRLA